MVQFVHPSKEDITLEGLLGALADPMRLQIMRSLMNVEGCMSCSEAAPCPNMAKSTLSHHFRMLREAGLIRTTKKGVENQNIVRAEEINERFPGLLALILDLSKAK
ncbi:helix-turn-helix domain-containing protein [Methylobacillus gramineus]|uniref:ArsR/SmtB family transcription factor n=1 Tax=Methylobacillus gramineus TaxID=755169 RepID=UPI001CFF7016|nr:helix-turn-helix domain-containing protein [Methylobacillus gramineus]MCB5184963.1 helix-turn-helix domain-containing protein [Methylobacillus gramineus]